MLNKMKDLAISKTAKIAINTQIEKYGKVSEISLNSKEKSLEMTLILKGENEAFHLSIEKYILSQKEDKHFIQVQGIQTSRLWMSAIAKDYLENKSFSIPNKYIKLLKTLI